LTSEKKLKIILTHDVDWPPAGPGLEHILARRNRFDTATIEKTINEGFNPYNNVDLLMEMEESHGLRSTFFFRPKYDDGTSAASYAGAIQKLITKGWEVGAHINDSGSFESILSERREVGACCGKLPIGCRAHYLRLSEGSHSYMRRAGFAYDSSLMFVKDQISPRNAGFLLRDGLVVFPITIMDAYLFTYMRVPEEKVTQIFDDAIRTCKDRQYMTVLWHDSSVLMKGGRTYSQLCERLATRDDVECVKAYDAFLSVCPEARK
jgi:peptidoglycan/xylan/chitin deacetylase (PgdA/CDA1 family)